MKLIKVKCPITDCPYSDFCPKIPCEAVYNKDKKIDYLFIGEAPGEKENKLIRPFIGRCGQLLRRTLKYIGLIDGYAFSNICRFWPRNDLGKTRRPEKDEMDRCIINLKRDIKILKPKMIIALGNTPLHALRPKADIISRERKFIDDIQIGKKTYIFARTYHPSHITQHMSILEVFQSDLRKIINHDPTRI